MALTLGGVTHAALLTNLFDAVGFFAASVFSYYAMELGENRTGEKRRRGGEEGRRREESMERGREERRQGRRERERV